MGHSAVQRLLVFASEFLAGIGRGTSTTGIPGGFRAVCAVAAVAAAGDWRVVYRVFVPVPDL